VLFSSRVKVTVTIRFSVWLVSGYAHVFIVVSAVIVIPINQSINQSLLAVKQYGGITAPLAINCVSIIIMIKRQFIRRSNMVRVTTRASYNVRCSYSGNN